MSPLSSRTDPRTAIWLARAVNVKTWQPVRGKTASIVVLALLIVRYVVQYLT